MRKIGFVFSSSPHGSASGREGLDAVLATSNYSEDVTLFFVGDGVMQLIGQQDPKQILCRDYISTFKLLALCGVENIFVCKLSLLERGLHDVPLIIAAKITEPDVIATQISKCRQLLQF